MNVSDALTSPLYLVRMCVSEVSGFDSEVLGFPHSEIKTHFEATLGSLCL